MPRAVAFATKPKLGRAMLERAFAAGVPCAWVTGDSVYGGDYNLRRAIERERRGYVLAVTSAQRLGFKPVADWLEDVPARAWRRLSAGDGAKGPRLYDWVWLPYRSDTAQGWHKGPLIRRQIADPHEFAFCLTLALEATTVADLVRVAGTRWTIGACFEAAKGETGLDQYEVRSWAGWHRHATLAMLAHAYLAVPRRAAIGGKATLDLAADLLPLTVPEVRRLLWRLAWGQAPDPQQILAWSIWRRRHQQRARRCHRRQRAGHEPRL